MAKKTAKPPAGRYRALTGLSLRARPDPACEGWLEWAEGDVFTPPAHMNVERCLERGIIESVADGGETEVTNDGEG